MSKHEQGFTLIELVVSMLILSISSLMFYASFTVILRTMKEGADIKNASTEIVAILEGSKEDDPEAPLVMKNTSASGKVILTNGDTITVSGNGYYGSKTYGKDPSDNVRLQKFTTLSYTKNEIFAMEFEELLNSIGGVGLSKAYIDSLGKEEVNRIIAELSGDTFYPNNDLYIEYLYKVYLKELNNTTSYVWPTVSITNMMSKEGTYIYSNHKDLKEKMYLVPYYMDPKDGTFLLSLRTTPAIEAKNWLAYFIFNDSDKHWYYRKSGYWLTNLTNKTEAEWNTLKQQMQQETDGWQRIFEHE